MRAAKAVRSRERVEASVGERVVAEAQRGPRGVRDGVVEEHRGGVWHARSAEFRCGSGGATGGYGRRVASDIVRLQQVDASTGVAAMAKFQKKVQKYQSIVPPPPERAKPSAQAQQALVEVATIAACIDGELESGEARALATQILATPGFEKYDGEQLGRTVEAIALQVAAEGIPARVRAIAKAIGNDPQTREEAFALATLFVLFDGEVGDEEQELLELLQKELHISDARASHITSLLADDGA